MASVPGLHFTSELALACAVYPLFTETTCYNRREITT